MFTSEFFPDFELCLNGPLLLLLNFSVVTGAGRIEAFGVVLTTYIVQQSLAYYVFDAYLPP
jgi:hypothetical protein